MTRYAVIYQSGIRFVLTGRLDVLDGGDLGLCPTIFSEGKVAHTLDPRALIIDLDTLAVEYNPRAHTAELSAPMQEWMVENQDWPSRVTSRFPAEWTQQGGE